MSSNDSRHHGKPSPERTTSTSPEKWYEMPCSLSGRELDVACDANRPSQLADVELSRAQRQLAAVPSQIHLAKRVEQPLAWCWGGLVVVGEAVVVG